MPGDYSKTAYGVIVYPHPADGGTQAMQLLVIRANIIRVTASPEKKTNNQRKFD